MRVLHIGKTWQERSCWRWEQYGISTSFIRLDINNLVIRILFLLDMPLVQKENGTSIVEERIVSTNWSWGAKPSLPMEHQQK